MAQFTITVNSYTNLPPDQIGNLSINLSYNETYTFTLSDFTSNTLPPYNDPEGDTAYSVKIVTLPSVGALELSTIAVSPSDEILVSSITAGNLKYIADAADLDGYTDIDLTFDVSDEGSNTFSGLTPGIVTFIVAEKNNQPPTIGDGTATINYGETLVFTTAMFTSLTTPAFSDPEGDLLGAVKILTLPTLGNIVYNGVNAVPNEIISKDDIDLGLLTYVPDLADTDGDLQGFTFEASDAGSGIFVG